MHNNAVNPMPPNLHNPHTVTFQKETAKELTLVAWQACWNNTNSVTTKDSNCCDSLLYKGSEDDDELGLEVTGWAWNKRTKTRTMMIATRTRVKGSMVAVRLRLWGVDKRTV